VTISKLALRAALAAALAFLASACGASSAPTAAAPTYAGAPPERVTDLSALSANSTLNASGAAAALRTANALERTRAAESDRAFLDAPGRVRHVGTEQNPGEETLLNAKAAKFPTFCGSLLDHLFTELRHRERDDDIAVLRLPTELRPVIITATLDKNGRIRELVLEQHSGKGIIDRLFIDACKKALWAPAPPRDALTPDGVYRVRIEGHLENYATLDEKHWNFKTFLGIALL
jgi:hypothetical protein